MATRWTIRHGLMLLWFTDLMNVTKEVYGLLIVTSLVTFIKSVNQSSIKPCLPVSSQDEHVISFYHGRMKRNAQPNLMQGLNRRTNLLADIDVENYEESQYFCLECFCLFIFSEHWNTQPGCCFIIIWPCGLPNPQNQQLSSCVTKIKTPCSYMRIKLSIFYRLM